MFFPFAQDSAHVFNPHQFFILTTNAYVGIVSPSVASIFITAKKSIYEFIQGIRNTLIRAIDDVFASYAAEFAAVSPTAAFVPVGLLGSLLLSLRCWIEK